MSDKLHTVVLADFDSWFWGLYNEYGETPDIKTFIEDLKVSILIEDLIFFGEFNKPEIIEEKSKLRAAAIYQIIDCSNNYKTNSTSSTMIEYIYPFSSKRHDIEQYILVTGDGRYQSVIAHLTTYMNKKVGVYALTGTLSPRLKECASWWKEILPKGNRNTERCKTVIFENLKWAEAQGFKPSFRKTLDACEHKYKLDRSQLSKTLKDLINQGLIEQGPCEIDGFQYRTLTPRWDKINKTP